MTTSPSERANEGVEPQEIDPGGVYLIDGVRTPFGRYRGSLSGLSAVSLATYAATELLRRHPQTLSAIDGVLIGHVLQAGQGQNSARQVAAASGIDLSVPAITFNSVCLSSLSAVADAARRIRLEEGDFYLVGGMDSMTNAPLVTTGQGQDPYIQKRLRDTMIGDGLTCALNGQLMGELSDAANQKLGVERTAQDRVALDSHNRAAAAEANGILAEERVVLELNGDVVDSDECIRSDTTAAKLAALVPAFDNRGSITAGNASQISDGASIGLVGSGRLVSKMNLQPLARVIGWSDVAGPDNTLHLQPAAAVEAVLKKTNLTTEQIDLFEINEAFAGVVVASSKELGLGRDNVNVNGGSIALGHPLAATGLRLLLTLAFELRRRRGGYGIAALCGGGGQGTAILIKRT